MSISRISGNFPVESVAAPAAGAATSVEAPTAGPAATWWVSPPGEYFSILHQISQAYPMELRLALRQFAEGPTTTNAPAAASASLASHAETPAPTAMLRSYAPHAATPPAVASTPVHRLVTAMQKLQIESQSAFHEVSVAVASSIGTVASEGTGPAAQDLVLLASQLEAAAMMAGSLRAAPDGVDPPAAPLAAVRAVAHVRAVASHDD
jgi:hypothetical protein